MAIADQTQSLYLSLFGRFCLWLECNLRTLCCANLVAEGLSAGQIAVFLGLRRADHAVWRDPD
ncbi:hypothetical protein [Polaromonas sp.]|uniref:hypothetical protein n=1 Tax=Polaromonas sp. TaxID=1869339 RepID=UPI00352BAB55